MCDNSMDVRPYDTDSEFAKYGSSIVREWVYLLSLMAPRVAWLLNIGVGNPKATKFFEELVNGEMERRRAMANPPQDVLGLMICCKDDKLVADDDEFGLGKSKKNVYMTDRVIARTIMQFFFDGYDTVASSFTLLFYYLAINPHIQEKAYEEIETIGKEELTTDDIAELAYLEQVLHETLRIAPFPFLLHRCTKDWVIPGTNVDIPKGMRVFFPYYSLHHDPANFPDPETFDPDRFSPERKREIATGAYHGFGIGPRQCLGKKIAILEAKVHSTFILHFLLFVTTAEPSLAKV